jgi:hypothetical protein
MNVKTIKAGTLAVGDVLLKRKTRGAFVSFVVDRKITKVAQCTAQRDNVHVNSDACYWGGANVQVKG